MAQRLRIAGGAVGSLKSGLLAQKLLLVLGGERGEDWAVSNPGRNIVHVALMSRLIISNRRKPLTNNDKISETFQKR
jgi:hypothetical protein